MSMKRSSLFPLILISGFLFYSNVSWANGVSCRFYLTGDPAELQGKIRAQVSVLKSLAESYRGRLGADQNPFSHAFTQERADQIFRRMLVRTYKGRTHRSPLAIVNQVLMKSYHPASRPNWPMVLWVTEEAKSSLAEGAQLIDLQSNLFALNLTLEYLDRYAKPEIELDSDGKPLVPVSEDKKNKEKEGEKKNEKHSKERSESRKDLRHPQISQEYKPASVGTPKSGQSKQVWIYRANFRTEYWGQRYFSTVVRGARHPLKEQVLPIPPNSPKAFREETKSMVVKTLGERSIELFLPSLTRPLRPSDPRASIKRSATGGYTLEVDAGLGEVVIPLVEDKDIVMPEPLMNLYTRPAGFKSEEWPEALQAAIFRRFPHEKGETNPLEIASAISNYISTQYLYSVGTRPETDPIEALKAGAFQCDIAAYAMIGILRDFYKIPSRVVLGYKAKVLRSGSKGESYMVLPDEAHAWVEVFWQGRWYVYDPTPFKKDQDKDQDEGSSEFEPVEAAVSQAVHQPSEDDGETDRNSDGARSANKDKEKAEGGKNKEALDREHRRRMQEASQRIPTKTQEDKTEDDGSLTGEPGSAGLDGKAPFVEVREPELRDGEIHDRNPLRDRAIFALLRAAVDPTQSGEEAQSLLNQLSSLVLRSKSVFFNNVYREALSAHFRDHPPLVGWVEEVIAGLYTKEINDSYQQIFHIRKALEVYSKMLDPNMPDNEGKIPPPRSLLASLDQVLREMDKLAHPDAPGMELVNADMALVNDLVRDLPYVLKLSLEKRYGLNSVGANQPTIAMANAIKRGEMRDVKLLTLLGPLVDFALRDTPYPEGKPQKTWERDRGRGRDLLPIERASDLRRPIFLRGPGGIRENIERGTAHFLGKRRVVTIPSGEGTEEDEKNVYLLVDTSGSMVGDPEKFQAGLAAAFVASGLSDISPSGRHRCKVWIVPYNVKAGEPIPVTNLEEATDLLLDYPKSMKNENKDTNIEGALLEVINRVAGAVTQNKNREQFDIIVMGDGKAPVDPHRIGLELNKFDNPPQISYVAINDTNESLIELVTSINGFYREFPVDLIKDILREASTVDSNERPFFSDRRPSEVPRSVRDLLNRILVLAQEFSKQISENSQFDSAEKNLDDLARLRVTSERAGDPRIEAWLIELRQFFMKPVFSRNPRLLERIADNVLKTFARLTAFRPDELPLLQQEQLRHLFKHAASQGSKP